MSVARNARRRYVLACTGFMTLYALLVVLISWVVDLAQLPPTLRLLAALSPALPLAGMLMAFDRYLRQEPDEFMGMLLARAAALAGGLLIVALTAWGFLEQYAGVPRFPLLLTFAVFWLLFLPSVYYVKHVYR
ncbi:hypothetical protein [Pseudomonas mangiferae]|uniref:Uncharacterized protein n=1 Tax=Pseudomonas mangiferae TaxID=2593654 RepID=A0A553GUH9_9PSED|nr:hypothetical protein [Pseudomonas mangiferae]TRX73178.1 hypothetical protein FM069_19220 [Pseudomonas mangiferae]